MNNLRRVAGSLPYALPEPHPLTAYLDTLIDAGIAPTLHNNVHLSIRSCGVMPMASAASG